MPRKPQSYNNTTPVQQFTETAYDAVVICADNIDDIIRSASGAEVMALYLGAHATEPTENNEGEPLVSGNFYLDTTTSSLKYWDSTNMVWVESDVDTVVTAAQAAIDARDAAQAAQTAAETAESNASTSAGQAASSASQAATSETNSANSATSSANSASAASADASVASASATAASNSATASEASNVSAGNHASNAAASESNAAASAVTASNAAAQAEAAFDNFDDMYLGRKTVPPTTDNDGNPLQVGASYWHDNGDSTGEQRFWNGASWESPELTATQAAQQAVAARDDAQISETNAELYKDAAQASANAAGVDANNAGNSATAAANSADTATTKAQEASDSADAANVSAGAASTSESNAAASATASANSATAAANSATEAANTVAEFDWQKFARGEAELNQLRQQNRKNRAASGFDEYGKQVADSSNFTAINEGAFVNDGTPYYSNAGFVLLGETTSAQIGTANHGLPMTCIAGLVSEIYGLTPNLSSHAARIKFPVAPNGTVIYDSSGDIRGTGNFVLDLTTDIDPKYANVAADSNEAVKRAFEGVLPYGNFRGASTGWAGQAGWSFNATDGIWERRGASSNSQIQSNQFAVIAGITYELGWRTRYTGVGSPQRNTFGDFRTGAGAINLAQTDNTSLNWVVSSERFTPTTSGNITFGCYGINNCEFDVAEVWVRPVTEEVVVDRHDMYGGEYFLEEITEAHPFVYDRGMIQSQSTSVSGITTYEDAVRPIEYFAVYTGDTSSRGKGVNWFNLSSTQKKQIVSDYKQNVFLLNDGRVVQWRMRQRTIKGLGNGDWNNLNPASENYLRYSESRYVKAQGQRDSVLEHDNSLGGLYVNSLGDTTWKPADFSDQGVWMASANSSGSLDTGAAVDGECYFNVWGVVRRLNEGCFHPSHNPLGSNVRWNATNSAFLKWYESTAVNPLTSSASCFAVAQPNSGGKLGGTSGRDDNRYCDAIYASGDGGVNDHRLSSWDMGSKEEASKVFQKVLNTTFRGEEKVYGAKVYKIGQATTAFASNSYRRFDCTEANLISVNGSTSSGRTDSAPHTLDGPRCGFVVDANTGTVWRASQMRADEAGVTRLYVSLASDGAPSGTYTNLYFVASPNTPNFDTAEDITDNALIYPESTVSGEVEVRDVFADPVRVLATEELAQGWQGAWSPYIPKGSTSEGYVLTRKSLYTGAGSCDATYTSDDGLNWAKSGITTVTSPVNTFGSLTQDLATGLVYIVSYKIWANMTQEALSKPVFNGEEGIGEVWAIQSNAPVYGCVLAESLMKKICTSTASGHAARPLGRPYDYYWAGNYSGELGTYYTNCPKHAPIDMPEPNNDSPAVKCLWYQTSDNGQVGLNIAFNELVWKDHGTALPVQSTAVQTYNKGSVYYVAVGDVHRGLLIHSATTVDLQLDGYSVTKDGRFISNASGNKTGSISVWEGNGWGDGSSGSADARNRMRIYHNTDTQPDLNDNTVLVGSAALTKPIGYTKNQARVGKQVEGVDL